MKSDHPRLDAPSYLTENTYGILGNAKQLKHHMVLNKFAHTWENLCNIEKTYLMVTACATAVVNLFDSIAQKEMTAGTAARHAAARCRYGVGISGECFESTKS